MHAVYGLILLLLAGADLAWGPRILGRISRREWTGQDLRKWSRLYRGMVAVGDLLLFLRLGATAVAVTAFILWTVLSQATVVDLRERRIPNPLTIGSLVLGVPLLLFLRPVPLGDAVLGFVVFLIFFLVLALLPGGGMGLGDAKLGAVMGLYLGLWDGILAFTIGFLIAGLYSIGLLLSGRGGWRSTFPLGPFLALGGFLALLLVPPGSGPLVIRL